jgi:DNA-binding CsgD family transcriptional regulator
MEAGEGSELRIVASTSDGSVVLSNGSVVTPRELDILRLVMGGARNREIAAQLFLSVHTVEYHVTHILQKLGARNRTEAGMKAARLGLHSVREDVRMASSTESRLPADRPRHPAGLAGWRLAAPLLLALGGVSLYLTLWGTPFDFQAASTNELAQPSEVNPAAPLPPDVPTD